MIETPVTMKAVMFAACEIGGLPRAELAGRGRLGSVVKIRQIAMWLMIRRIGASYSEVGRMWSRDHTTVIHAVQAVDRSLAFGGENSGTKALLTRIWERANEVAPEILKPTAIVHAALVFTPPKSKPKLPPKVVSQDDDDVPVMGPVTSNWRKYQPFSEQWWAANDLSFKEGLAAAYPKEIRRLRAGGTS